MPTSPSRKRGASQPAAAPAPQFLRPLMLIAGLAVLVVIVVALPASLIGRWLPATVAAQEFSGSLWHGSAQRVAVGGRSLGAIEWHLHPWSLLRLAVVADLHWVTGGFVADGLIDLTQQTMTLQDLQGGGPIEDLKDLGVPLGWRGTAAFKFSELQASFPSAAAANESLTWTKAVGDLRVFDLSAGDVAHGAELGGYTLHLANAAITPGADASAELADMGGPVEALATIHFSPDGHTGMLSGTIRARPEAPPALAARIASLQQLHAPDARGAIPVELEFTL